VDQRTRRGVFDHFDRVIWIGVPEEAEAAVLRVLKDKPIDGALFRNEIDISISSRGAENYEYQRQESELIRHVLSSPPHQSAPYVDQMLYWATMLANGSNPATPTTQPKPSPDAQPSSVADAMKAAGKRSNPDSTKDSWPPDKGWHIGAGEFAFNGNRFPMKGVHLKILKVFVDANRSVTRNKLVQDVWGQDHPEHSGLSSTLCNFRKRLRVFLRLPDKFNPLPHVDIGQNLAWKLDKGGIREKVQAEIKPV
jgi:hypothetical protein